MRASRIADEVQDPLAEGCAMLWRVEIECWLGRASEAANAVDALEKRRCLSVRNMVASLFVDLARGKCELALGRNEPALSYLRRAEALAERIGYRPMLLAALVAAVEACVELGERSLAQETLARARAFANQIADPRYQSIVDTLEAQSRGTENGEEPLEWCGNALRLQLDNRYELDRLKTLLVAAELLMVRGRHIATAHVLGALMAQARGLGVHGRRFDRQRARALLAQLRAALDATRLKAALDYGALLGVDAVADVLLRDRGDRIRATFGWESVTPTERVVVRFIAEGLTTPQIAARMGISAGTVKSHLSHIFAKLGISRRSELAAEATRQIRVSMVPEAVAVDAGTAGRIRSRSYVK
jgi:DNA-binding CsgD family transcriptional regulator